MTDVGLDTERVKEALFEGRKIEAIRLYREHARVGLAEAKRAVEELERQLRVSEPGRFKAPAGPRYIQAMAVVLTLALLAWRYFHGH